MGNLYFFSLFFLNVIFNRICRRAATEQSRTPHTVSALSACSNTSRVVIIPPFFLFFFSFFFFFFASIHFLFLSPICTFFFFSSPFDFRHHIINLWPYLHFTIKKKERKKINDFRVGIQFRILEFFFKFNCRGRVWVSSCCVELYTTYISV